jgi:hypothetical protein
MVVLRGVAVVVVLAVFSVLLLFLAVFVRAKSSKKPMKTGCCCFVLAFFLPCRDVCSE